MKYVILNLETNEYLSLESNFIYHKQTGDIFFIKWTKYKNFAKQMFYDESEDMYDYLKKDHLDLKIEIKNI